MARKKTINELRIEREKAEQDLKLRQENLKKLKAKETELTRNARTHRLCTHGAMLEQYLSPDEFTTEQIELILKALFRRSDNQEMIQSVKRQAEDKSEVYKVPYCVRAQLYTMSPQTPYHSLPRSDGKARPFRCGAFSPHSHIDFVGPQRGAIALPEGSCRGLDGEKAFSPSRGRCTSPAPLRGYPFASMTERNGCDHPFLSIMPLFAVPLFAVLLFYFMAKE